MCHVYALSKRQFQYLVSLCRRFIYYMHSEFACIVGELFKFIHLKLNAKRCILHFKCAGDLLVRNKFMDHSVRTKHNFSLRVCRFQLPAAMFLTFKFKQFCRGVWV